MAFSARRLGSARAARDGALVALFVLVTLVLVAVHLQRGATAALEESDRALAAGDPVTAVERARDAAQSLAPGSRSDEGYARLRAIALAAEARGSLDEATFAWRATWTALRSTRSETRAAGRLAEAARGLVRVATRACEGGQTRLPATCGAAVQAALVQDDLPPLARFDWLAVGALAFLGGGAAATQSSDSRRRSGWLLVTAAGLVAAMVALLGR